MIKKIILSLFFISTLICRAYPALPEADQLKDLEPIKAQDRIVIFAPHPDDETIACAGVIQEAMRVGASLKIVYLTNGEHNELAFIVYEKRIPLRTGEFIHMGEVRRGEAIRAMQLLGLDEKNLIFLGYPDFGISNIFMNYWQAVNPSRSMLTRISRVPYKENLSFGSPYVGESILGDLEKVLREYKPNKIFVSHPADVNTDHKALYLFLQIALADLKGALPEPKVYPYLVHHVGWPLPRHYHPELSLDPPKEFLDSQVKWFQLKLDREELDKKYKATLCYKSQTESSAFYLLSFARKNELFGDYPPIKIPLPKLKADAVAPADNSWQNHVVSFFGASNMYTESSINVVTEVGNALEGKGQVTYGMEDGSLVICIQRSKHFNRRFSVIFYLCGYNDKIAFSRMPKILIVTRGNKLKVLNKRRPVTAMGVSVELDKKDLTLKVPLTVLGQPDFVLVSLKTYAGFLPVDAVSFRKIDLVK
jgi:LmbE family N-acetylglucosaminyl deacetylase